MLFKLTSNYFPIIILKLTLRLKDFSLSVMDFFSWTFAPMTQRIVEENRMWLLHICLQTSSSPKKHAKTFFLQQQGEEHANVAQKPARCFISLLQTPLLLPNKDKVAKICVGVHLARPTVNVTGLIFIRRQSITPSISSLSGLIWSSIMIRIMLKHFSPSYERGGKKTSFRILWSAPKVYPADWIITNTFSL